MTNLSAQRILEVWDQAVSSTDEAKTQALLSLVTPELSKQSITEMVLGERNVNLLELHQRMFGPKLQAYIECTQCGEALDIEFAIDELGFSSTNMPAESFLVSMTNIKAQVRLPNNADLNELTTLNNLAEGRQLLFSRCVLGLHRNDVPVEISDLNQDELDQLEEAISALDPRMEILFDLQCPQCRHSWQSPLELGSYLWSEYDLYARQLLENIHLLASCYGWSQTDILTMSQQRRQYYLARIRQ